MFHLNNLLLDVAIPPQATDVPDSAGIFGITDPNGSTVVIIMLAVVAAAVIAALVMLLRSAAKRKKKQNT